MRRARGQATVELALFGLVLVPVILYTMFLHDLLRYKLDLIEAVTTVPWDFTTLDWEGGIDATKPPKWNRHSWCDHTTAYNSYDKSKECGDQNHHEALSAHACWLVKGAQQVQCSLDTKFAKDGFKGKLADDASTGVNVGGKFYCSAKLGVINYFLPQKIFASFTEQQTISKKEMHGRSEDVHEFGKSSTMEDEYLLATQSMSIVADPWAMKTVEDVDNDSNSGGVLYKRTEMGWDKDKAQKAKDVGKGLIDDDILNSQATKDEGHKGMLGDDPTTIQVGWSKKAGPDVKGNWASAWSDSNQKVEATYNKRAGHYMGSDKEPN